tara:strand:+ start:296 stop:439 length:144 start_codon:yes stop_codon:yes gene_type:complete
MVDITNLDSDGNICLMPHKFTKKTGDLILCGLCGIVVNPEKLAELAR